MENSNSHIDAIFSQAYILGGSPCSGKSTIADKLAARYELVYYKVDDQQDAHLSRVRAQRHPVMHRYLQMDWDQIWSRPPELQMREELDFFRERFEMLLEDLSAFSLETPVLLEGAGILPELVCEFGLQPGRAVFMVPSWEFQVGYYSQRPWIREILAECRQPEQAFENWMRRDHLFGLEVLRQAEHYGYPTIVVDGTLGIAGRLEQVRSAYGLHT